MTSTQRLNNAIDAQRISQGAGLENFRQGLANLSGCTNAHTERTPMNPKDFLIEAAEDIYEDDYDTDSSLEMLVLAIVAAAFVFAALAIII